MTNRPRNIGTATESAVVRVLHAHGFPHAERRQLRGRLDCGDITGCPGLVWEVKGGAAAKQASDAQIADWLVETERERVNARADIGILVLPRKGIGARNAGRWWAVMAMDTLTRLNGRVGLLHNHTGPEPVRLHLRDTCTLLRAAGYGTPLEVAS